MANVTERIKEGVVKAMQNLENGDSVRRACKKAGISVTSLYHNSTAQQREQAYLKNTSPAVHPMESRGPGRRRKVKTRRQPAPTNDISLLQKQLNESHAYIVKLEHELVKYLVLEKGEQ